MMPAFLALLFLLAEPSKSSCLPPLMLRIIKESRVIRLVRLESRRDRNTDPFARDTTFVGFHALDSAGLSANARLAVARAFSRREGYTCEESAQEKDPSVRWPLQIGFDCESDEGRVRIVLLEPERRLLMHLSTGTFRDLGLSAEGVRAWAEALGVLALERHQQEAEFLAHLTASADTTPSSPASSAPPASQAMADSIAVDLTQKPVDAYLKTPPVYPDMAREAGVDGVVLLDVLVGPDGLVRTAKVVKSIPMLDSSAIAAVRRWRYRPFLQDSVARTFWTRAEVKFALH